MVCLIYLLLMIQEETPEKNLEYGVDKECRSSSSKSGMDNVSSLFSIFWFKASQKMKI